MCNPVRLLFVMYQIEGTAMGVYYKLWRDMACHLRVLIGGSTSRADKVNDEIGINIFSQ